MPGFNNLLPLTDTHCHLDFRTFDGDRQSVQERALQTGIVRILNPGIDLLTSQAAILLAESSPAVFAAVGIHPNDGSSWNEKTRTELHRLAGSSRKVVAVGEIGLDFYRDRVERNLQKQIFQAQLELAAELSLPVLIHTRQAMQDILPLVDAWRKELIQAGSPLVDRPGVFHSFDGTLEEARQLIAMNFMIGVSGPVTFPNAAARQAVMAGLPLTSLLLETDAPFLTPQPRRGQRNEPAYVHWIAEKIALLKNQPLPAVVEATHQNASRLFAWGD